MAYTPNPFDLATLTRALSMVPNFGAPVAATTPAAQAATATGAATPAVTPTVTPEQQQILAGANAPSLAPQAAALQEQRIQESQNPQLMQQNPQQQQQPQNSPGGMPQQGQSALGNFSQEQAQQGQQGAQTNSEKSWWDTAKSTLTGEGLQGQELQDWRKNMSLGTALAQLGGAIGGQTTGGRLGEGVYQVGAGSLASKNAELRDQRQDEFNKAVIGALGGRMPTTQAAAQNQTQGSSMAQNQPTQQSMPTGESALQGDMQSLIADYDKMMARLTNLGSRV